MGLVVLLPATTSLFLVGTSLQLFATTSMGNFMGTVARLVPRLGLKLAVVLPLQMFSGSITPRQSSPPGCRWACCWPSTPTT
jgi:ABC-2 type transport system permease protein